MFPILRATFVLLFAVVLVGCATSSAIPLNPEATAQIQSTRAHIVIPQQEIGVAIDFSTIGYIASASIAGVIPALGGLAVDALVTSSRAEKASLRIEPLRKQLTNFDFRAEYDKKFRVAMAGHPWLKVDQIEVTGLSYSADDRNHMLAATPQNSLLVMAVDYQLSPDLRCLIVRSTVSFWQRGREEAQYLGEYRYLSAPVSPKSDEDAVTAWVDNDAKLLRTAIREGIDETIRMLKLDFVPKTETQQEDADLGEVGKIRVVSIKASSGPHRGGVTTSKVEELASKILATDNDRIIFRSKYLKRYTLSGHIYSTTTRKFLEIPSAVSSVKPIGAAP